MRHGAQNLVALMTAALVKEWWRGLPTYHSHSFFGRMGKQSGKSRWKKLRRARGHHG